MGVGDVIGSIISDTNQMKQELAVQGGTNAIADQITGEITPEHRTTVISKKVLDGVTLFWDTDIQGDWDDYDWSGDADMDGYTSKTWVNVLNKDNTFEDYFETNTFVDTDNSDGTGDYTTDYDYTLTANEILQSKLIAINNTNYSRGTLIVEGTNTESLTLYLSADGGSNWESVTNNTEHLFTNTSTSGIKYKVENTSGSGFPTAWGTWGELAETITITNISVRYS